METLSKRIVENGLVYYLIGDYYFPDLAVEEENRSIGRWGRMHRVYLQAWRSVVFGQFLQSGKLHSYLADLNEHAETRVEVIILQMKEAEGVTEALKAENQMEWVRRMNSIRNRAEELVRQELIFC